MIAKLHVLQPGFYANRHIQMPESGAPPENYRRELPYDPGAAKEVLPSIKEYKHVPVHPSFLHRCTEVVLSNIDDPGFTVEMLAQEMRMSHSSLYKKLKSVVGLSVNEFMRRVRLEQASRMLMVGRHNINEAAYHSGFNDLKYFRKQFKKVYKMSPSAYRKKYFSLPKGEYLHGVRRKEFSDLYQFTP